MAPPSTYSPEFREEAVLLALKSSRTASAVAREFELNPETLRGWVKKHQKQHAPSTDADLTMSERARLKEPERLIHEVEMENAFLKRSAGVLRERPPTGSTYEFIETMRLGTAEYAYPVEFMCEHLGVSKSGYYDGRQRPDPAAAQRRQDLVPCRPRPKQWSLTRPAPGSVPDLVRTADGVEGVGEAVVPGGPWWGGESIEGVKNLIDDYLAPLLMGHDAARVEHLARFLDRTVAAARFAKAAVEMALWDARGKASGVPLYELLGGLSRDSIPVTWALGAEPADVVIDEIEQQLDTGMHRSFKLKMGGAAPADDVSRITAVAQALADRTSLRVDLNGSWDELTATRWLPALQDAGIELIEQPVPAWNTPAMARLAERLIIPLMADESLQTPQDAARLGAECAADVFAVKVAKSGGISAAQRIITLAETAGIPCHGGTTIESSIGTAAGAHLCCAAPGVSAGSELFGPLLLADDLVENPVTYTDGELRPPRAPGLGVTLDEKRVAKYTRD